MLTEGAFTFLRVAASLVVFLAVILFAGSGIDDVIAFLIATTSSISFFVALKHVRGFLFEPSFVFCVGYGSAMVAAVHYKETEFADSVVMNSVGFYTPLQPLFVTTLTWFLVGLICFCMGYWLVRRREISVPKIRFEAKSVLSSQVLWVLVVIGLATGVLNFFWIVKVGAGGDVIEYFRSVAGRRHQLEEVRVSALGYNLYYGAIYVWLFILLREGRAWSVPFLVALMIGLVIKISTGRVTQSVAFIGSFLVIWYYWAYSGNPARSNRRAIIGFSSLVFLAITLYMLRVLSSLHLMGAVNENTAHEWFDLEKMRYLLIDRGNVPAIPVTMKIIDSWETDFGFLYGRSIPSGLLSLVPDQLLTNKTEAFYIAWMMRSRWFWSFESGIGGMPPTVVGEMWANFGPLGPSLGLFSAGAGMAFFFNLMVRKQSYWLVAMYGQLLLGSIAILPKNDFSAFSPWYVLPIAMFYLAGRAASLFSSR